MARWGSCDFKELKKFQEKLEKLSNAEITKFCQDVSRKLAARLLRKVIKRTPVGDYSQEVTVVAKRDGKKHKKGETYTRRINPSGKVGGTLRRGWTAKSEQEAMYNTLFRGESKNIEDWVNELPIKKVGNLFQIDVTNVVNYSSYVEYGHRQEPGRYVPAIGKRLKTAWVPGQFMMTISEQEINAMLPKFIEKKMIEFLREVF